MKKFRNGQRGFTLIELIVVIAILGVLAAVVVPMVASYLNNSKTRAYDADAKKIQSAVDAYYSKPGNTRFIGKRQYPLIGRALTSQTDQTVQTSSTGLVDDRDPFNTSSDLWNPNGGTEGADLSATSVWIDDDTDGVRDIDASGANADSWTTVSVTRNSVTYYTDPRYFLIDFEALASDGFLKAIPDSASPDNKPSGSTSTYTGSYIWYIDSTGKVQSLYVEFPDTTTSVTGVYP